MVKILFEQKPLNPVNLENILGLNRGDIVEVTIHAWGGVGVDFAVPPTTALKDNVEAELNKRGLLRGKKPKEE